MATPFFGKREDPSVAARSSAANSGYGGLSPAAQPASQLGSFKPLTEGGATSSVTANGGSKLTVGPNIKLKGVEITDCDTLVVDGTVEATMNARVIQISEQGAFKGSAELDLAEIRGEFNGNLTVRQKLVIYSTGKVTGTIRYGKLVVEEGAHLSGEIGSAAPAQAGKPAAVMGKSGLLAA
jgi:cytoskeletal protein CcmA (bactofilin family)